MAFKKGQGRLGGRQKGALNKRSEKFSERLKELDCDPQEFLALVMIGEEPSLGTHCFYKHLTAIDETLNDQKTAPTPDEWAELMEIAQVELKYGQAGLSERIGIAKELLPYIAPKLRQVDIDVDIEAHVKTSGVLAVPTTASDVNQWLESKGDSDEAIVVEVAQKEANHEFEDED